MREHVKRAECDTRGMSSQSERSVTSSHLLPLSHLLSLFLCGSLALGKRGGEGDNGRASVTLERMTQIQNKRVEPGRRGWTA